MRHDQDISEHKGGQGQSREEGVTYRVTDGGAASLGHSVEARGQGATRISGSDGTDIGAELDGQRARGHCE